MTKTVNYKVSLGKDSYPIFIGKNLLKSLKNHIPNFYNYSKIIIVSDSAISSVNELLFKKYLPQNFNFKKIILPSGEKIKSFKYLEILTEKILSIGIDRTSL